MTRLNETHDPHLKSWLASANTPASDFPIQNLPLAVFKRKNSVEAFRGGVAIGDQILDLAALAASGVITGDASTVVQAGKQDKLNALMARALFFAKKSAENCKLFHLHHIRCFRLSPTLEHP